VSLLDARALSKSYGGVRVLKDVDLSIEAGEIRALVGENGAGKSTCIKILSGAIAPDAGEIRLEGSPLPLGQPLAIRQRGVSVVYQEFTLAPDSSVADNIFLGRERGRWWLRRREMREAAERRLADLGVRVDASTAVRGLSVAHQQMVEIARALMTDAKILILDEPSAALSATEVDRLLDVLRQLRARGLGILYISHRLDEIFGLADSVTVLRDGAHVATGPTGTFDRASLIRAMVGRDVSEEYPARRHDIGAPVIEVSHLASPGRFSDVSFSVRQGEIVGLAGLVGAGRTSTALALIGALPFTGDVRLDGRPVHFRMPDAAIRAGLAYVTEDRKKRGIFPIMGTGANITVTFLEQFTRAGVLSLARERAGATAAARDFDLRASSLDQPAATLSGGNQQKALVARYLLERRTLVILDEPTRGVDVGARAEIYRIMNRLTEQGLAVLMISSDLPEVLGMADRVVVMHEGRTTGTLDRAEATPERVMTLATSAA
jgi:rhamnose transport system ATP-binding protein